MFRIEWNWINLNGKVDDSYQEIKIYTEPEKRRKQEESQKSELEKLSTLMMLKTSQFGLPGKYALMFGKWDSLRNFSARFFAPFSILSLEKSLQSDNEKVSGTCLILLTILSQYFTNFCFMTANQRSINTT